MSDEFGFGGGRETQPELATGRRTVVPMQVGSATVYVEQVGELLEIQTDEQFYPVSAPSTKDAFEEAIKILQECVQVIGERVNGFREKVKPKEVTVEFTLSFEAKGRAQLIPVLLTGETTAATGLNVTAVWDLEP